MISKKIISIFTFGIFLVIVGAVSKIMKWHQGDLLMAIGILFELLALLLFLWRKLKN